MITIEDIRNNPNFRLMIKKAHDYLTERGYTEHGFRHVTFVSRTTARILRELGYDQRTVELGAIAGYLHDIGNMFNRKHHGISGANIVYTELRQMGMPLDEICDITMAIANHEEETGKPVSPITAALIIADKSDAHRTRVHRKNSSDIHDRVNLAILDSRVEINKEALSISLLIDFDQNSCEIMDYFAIYLKRMTMCKDAAAHLGCEFHLFINNLELLGMAEQRRAAGQI